MWFEESVCWHWLGSSVDRSFVPIHQDCAFNHCQGTYKNQPMNKKVEQQADVPECFSLSLSLSLSLKSINKNN